MSSLEDITGSSRENLLALVAHLQRQIAELQRQVTRLTATNEELSAQNARLQRSGKRQAAPCSKGTRVTNPKGPGRKLGFGDFSFRPAPQPEEIPEPPVDVPGTLEACPDCGGSLEEERVDFA